MKRLPPQRGAQGRLTLDRLACRREAPGPAPVRSAPAGSAGSFRARTENQAESRAFKCGTGTSGTGTSRATQSGLNRQRSATRRGGPQDRCAARPLRGRRRRRSSRAHFRTRSPRRGRSKAHGHLATVGRTRATANSPASRRKSRVAQLRPPVDGRAGTVLVPQRRQHRTGPNILHLKARSQVEEVQSSRSRCGARPTPAGPDDTHTVIVPEVTSAQTLPSSDPLSRDQRRVERPDWIPGRSRIGIRCSDFWPPNLTIIRASCPACPGVYETARLSL